jgi:hypothetical protein
MGGVITAIITALVGLYFNAVTARQAAHQLELSRDQTEVTRQGQLTDRYNKAVEQLGAAAVDVRLGGTYALQRLAHDSPPDRSTIVEVLSAFVRDNVKRSTPNGPAPVPPGLPLPTDLDAALTVLHRLGGARLTGAHLPHAVLTQADLTGADLPGADLTGAYLYVADLTGADLTAAYLTGADLTGANLTGADLTGADLTGADLTGADLTGADLTGVYGFRSPAPSGIRPS